MSSTWAPSCSALGSENGAEVLGGVVKWRLGCNWKVPTPDVDTTHGWITHRSIAVALGVGATGNPVRPGQGRSESVGVSGGRTRTCVSFPEGHTMSVTGAPRGRPELGRQRHVGQHALIREYFREKYELRKQRLGKLASSLRRSGHLPERGWLGRVVRIMHPHGPGTTEIWTYFFVDKDAPQEVKSALGHYYEHYYGPGGMTQKDDMENWYQLTIASRGPMARKLDLNYQMGIDNPPLHGPSTYGLPGLFTRPSTTTRTIAVLPAVAEVMEARDWDEMRVKEPVK